MQLKTESAREGVTLHIPSALARQASLLPNCFVEVEIVGGRLVVGTATEQHPTLEQLLAGVTEENRHDEVSTGHAVGAEVW